jgi:hypothetical protein
MGEFAISVAIAYQTGAGRGDYSILSAMGIGNDELFTAFGASINDLILQHRTDLERKREASSLALKVGARWLQASSTAAGPKTRWIDGTPEYSLHICGLRKVFPDALFIHIVRDVESVVRSMVNFHRATGIHLVRDEEDAYGYWLRTVSACLTAERAYGPNVVRRVRYAELINSPESTMRSLLAFLEEPYTEECLEPLKLRINSSDPAAGFADTDTSGDSMVAQEAIRLSAEIEKTSQPAEASSAAADEMAAAFETRAQYIAALHDIYQAEKSKLESAISEYQVQNSKLQSTIAELRAQVQNLGSRSAHASRVLDS